jgi:hypothetical protein
MSLRTVTGVLLALSLASSPALACKGTTTTFSDEFTTEEPSWQALYGEFSVANGHAQLKSDPNTIALVVNTGDYFDGGELCVDVIAPDYRAGGIQVGGLVFGLKDDANYFAVWVSPADGLVGVVAKKKGEWVMPVPGRRNEAIKKESGAANQLRVSWKSSRAVVYVNDKQFAAFAMPPMKNAHFGMWAQTEGNTWQYDRFKITD